MSSSACSIICLCHRLLIKTTTRLMSQAESRVLFSLKLEFLLKLRPLFERIVTITRVRAENLAPPCCVWAMRGKSASHYVSLVGVLFWVTGTTGNSRVNAVWGNTSQSKQKFKIKARRLDLNTESKGAKKTPNNLWMLRLASVKWERIVNFVFIDQGGHFVMAAQLHSY